MRSVKRIVELLVEQNASEEEFAVEFGKRDDAVEAAEALAQLGYQVEIDKFKPRVLAKRP
jgi:hypothetical protein